MLLAQLALTAAAALAACARAAAAGGDAVTTAAAVAPSATGPAPVPVPAEKRNVFKSDDREAGLWQFTAAGTTGASSEGPLRSWSVDLGGARRASGGVFSIGEDGGAELVRQLWANQPVSGDVVEVQWDGRDAVGTQRLLAIDGQAGEQLPAADFEFRWLDTSAVRYEWEGVIGNTGPSIKVPFCVCIHRHSAHCERNVRPLRTIFLTAVGESAWHWPLRETS